MGEAGGLSLKPRSGRAGEEFFQFDAAGADQPRLGFGVALAKGGRAADFVAAAA